MPLLVWPVGILLIVGYCAFTRRSTVETRVVRERAVVSVSEAIGPKTIDLRIPLAIVGGVLLALWTIRSLRERSDRDESDRPDGTA